jgi:hypothetical protein
VTTSKSIESGRNVVWALSNLCRSRSRSVYRWKKFSPVVESIRDLLNSKDEDLLAESCWTLAYLMDGNNSWSPIEEVLNAGLVFPLVNLFNVDHRNPNRVLESVVRALGNIVTGTAQQTQVSLLFFKMVL